MTMNACMENNKQAGYNIAYNSLERRFSKRGAVDIVNQLADEQQKKEKETAELSPVCYRLGAHKSSNDWNVRYRTGNTDGEYFMTVADYKRCFCEGMGYRPDNVIRTRAESKAEKWEADHNIELILTGFPGETDARFQTLLSDLRRMQFDHLGAFAYSPEEGTAGAKLSARPSKRVALAREKQVMREAANVWKVKSRRLLGQIFRALIVAPGIARMASQAPEVDGVVYLLDSRKARRAHVGDFVQVRLVKVCGFDFEGDVV